MVGGPRRAARTFQELQRKAENIQRAAVLWKWFVDASSETTRLLWADWTATVSQITAHYNQHMQKNIWKHVEHSECSSWQLRTGGNIHPGSPESSKSLTKSSGAEECPCLPWRSDGRVRTWGKQHESVAPPCLASTVQAAVGVMVPGTVSWHTLGSLAPTEHFTKFEQHHLLYCWSCPCPSSDGGLKLKLLSWTWQCVHAASTVTGSHRTLWVVSECKVYHFAC